MARVGCPGERLRLAPLEMDEDLDRDTSSIDGHSLNGKAEQRAMRPMDDSRVRTVRARAKTKSRSGKKSRPTRSDGWLSRNGKEVMKRMRMIRAMTVL